MGEAKQPGGAACVLKADAPRVRPYRREKLRSYSHAALSVTRERRRRTIRWSVMKIRPAGRAAQKRIAPPEVVGKPTWEG
jgi:hypothetical protein